MPESIRDGQGQGYLAGVNSENRLLIAGPTVTQEHHTNFVHQDAYNILFSVTPSGAGDTFLYLKNTAVYPIVLEGYSIRAASDEEICVHLGVTGTPAGGTDVVPANLYAGSANNATGVYQIGADITGLTGGVEVANYYIAGSNDSAFRNFDADIVIPPNQTFMMCVSNGSIAIKGFLVMWLDHTEG